VPESGKTRRSGTLETCRHTLRRQTLSVLCLVLSAANLVEAGSTLADARKSLLGGNYAEARAQYAALAGPERTKAIVGASQAYQEMGDYDNALAIVEAQLKSAPKEAALLARRAEVLYLRGRLDEAEQAARAALAAADGSFLAHWILGQVLRDRGELDKADEEFRWFVRAYNDKDLTDPDELLLVGQAALERARVHHLDDQYPFVLKEIFREALKLDKHFWRGEYEAGRLFLEKHNKADAHKAFDKALVLNPRAAEVLVCKGEVALQGLELQEAEQFAEQALKINPRLPAALRLRADVAWFGGDAGATLKDLDKARSVNPRDEETLGRIAACLFAQKKETDFATLSQEVQKHNAKPYLFYAILGDRLKERKQYSAAEKFFRRAVELRPELPDGLVGLGMLHLQQGREDEARKELEQAFKADNFNVRVSNSLKVLDHLAKYETLQTKHFHIRHDPKNDAVLAKYMARYLEQIYEELAERFDYRPAGPFLIEIFNKHEMFSGRIIALPDLHTIGACTGPLVAMVSPHDKSKVIGKAFNWVRVLRHELVHVFNLEQTASQVPHWLTEGLAVTYEGSATPPSWHYLLAEKVRGNDLLNLDNILLGFARPRSPAQWQQAYLQSQLYVEYLTKTYGPKAVGKMLAAFAAGLETGAALEQACGVRKEDFEKGYRAFLDERVRDIALKAPTKTQTLRALKAAHAKNPDDVDVAAQLAERYYHLGNKKEAGKLADQALDAKPRHPLAGYVKALLLLDAGDAEVAFTLLERIVDADTTDVKPLKLLGRAQFEVKKYAAAARTYERCRKLEPHEAAWLAQLAKVYPKAEEPDKLAEVYRELAKIDYDDPLPRRRLARQAADAGKHADAERYARLALEIDVLDADSQKILLDALRAQGKEQEEKELREIFGR
jgi:cellulose synthase operon protein C